MKALLIGYGNPGRGDDALGPALAEAIEGLQVPGLEVEVDFQLNVEDAYDLKDYDAAIFADATVAGDEPFLWRRIQPADSAQFSSHAASPEGVLQLAKKLFGINIDGYVLGIRGYEFETFGAPLTPRAQDNLRQAIAFLADRLRGGDGGLLAPA